MYLNNRGIGLDDPNSLREEAKPKSASFVGPTGGIEEAWTGGWAGWEESTEILPALWHNQVS